MSKRRLVVALAASVTAVAGEPDRSAPHACLQTLWKQTKVVVVQLSAPVSEFKPNADPNTLELVIVKEDGTSRVSDDGEAIFLYNSATGAEFESLFEKAFAIRARSKCGV